MDQTMSRLTDIVGNEGVIDHPDPEETFSLDHRLVPSYEPSRIVRPRNVDEVQKVVRWANETLTPLVPVSSGKPHLRGDTIPTSSGSVMVDLSGMNRILKINRRNRLALLEPGVTYSQLLPELRKEGLRINMPLLPRGNKSVLASFLEREPLMFPKYQWNMSEPLRSLEIVWGNGDKLWSGGGVNRGEKEEDWEVGLIPVVGPGPGQLDYYKFVSAAQGSMGIVTWASIKCEVYPDSRKLFFVSSEKLDKLIELMYQLLRFRFGDELFIVNNTCLAYILANHLDEIQALIKIFPPWIMVVGISGGQILPDERVAAQENDIQDLVGQLGLKMVPEMNGYSGRDYQDLLQKPSAEPFWKLRAKGSMQEIFFLSTLDKTPGYVSTMCSLAEEHQFPIPDIAVYLQPVHQGVSCHCEFILPFERENQLEVTRTEALFRNASQILFTQKAYYSRPYGIWADLVYDADPTTEVATKKMKDIFDPNHVMNPGKLCF